ncbi:hypothetical protein L484_026812 [Morus notabilis]|uniref:Uncharacterized protein n=1 Tax=Morus notabilis TaxID=981085 RepID=W9T144_9ROSA|nr:hypothetical protein L484_026812 [Morus notabilis]
MNSLYLIRFGQPIGLDTLSNEYCLKPLGLFGYIVSHPFVFDVLVGGFLGFSIDSGHPLVDSGDRGRRLSLSTRRAIDHREAAMAICSPKKQDHCPLFAISFCENRNVFATACNMPYVISLNENHKVVATADNAPSIRGLPKQKS